jgi:hypothetical protein
LFIAPPGGYHAVMHYLFCRPGGLFIGLLTAAALFGCGTGGSGSQFPSREQVQRLAEHPAAAYQSRGQLADVEEWELTGPLPSQISDEPAALSEPWSSVAAELAAKRPGLVLASSSAACTARELGLFYAAKRAGVTQSLQRFIAARCGLTGTLQIAYGYRSQEIHGATDERQIASEWSTQLKSEMQKALGASSGAHLIGFWLGRRGDFFVATWVVAPRQARIESMAMLPAADGQVVVRGEVLYRAEKVEGLINRGRYGFRRCETDPHVKMPQFALRCQADSDDDSANLQVAAFEPGRVLGRIILSFVVWPRGELGKSYRRPALAGTDSSQAGPNAAPELALLVDRVRKEAGMKSLKLSDGESHAARRLAPHYFAALIGLENEEVADQVVLGLRAGWDVGARLRTGQFTFGICEGSTSTARMLSEVLDSPAGREALLDPQADHLAVGVIGSPRQGFLGALFATYANFELGDVQAHVNQVERRLNELRARRGLPRAERLPKLEADLAAVVGKVSNGEVDAKQGLEQATAIAAELTHMPVRAFYVDAIDLADLAIPDEIIATQSLRVAIGVGEHQVAGDPWHRYIAYFVIADGTDVVALAGAFAPSSH